MLDKTDSGERAELVDQIRRLNNIMLEKLEEGSREKLLDHNQTRLLGSIALRVLKLWKEVLAGRVRPGTARNWMEEAEEKWKELEGTERTEE
jgi:hypothetical protein